VGAHSLTKIKIWKIFCAVAVTTHTNCESKNIFCGGVPIAGTKKIHALKLNSTCRRRECAWPRVLIACPFDSLGVQGLSLSKKLPYFDQPGKRS
jgi:hypothetical protein